VIRPAALLVLVFRLVLVVMLAARVTVVLVPAVAVLLKLSVRIPALFLATQAGCRNKVRWMRGHGVSSRQPDR